MILRPRDETKRGRRVRLISHTDQYSPLKPGTLGRIQFTDGFGTVHVRWDDGSNLGLIATSGDLWVECNCGEVGYEQHIAICPVIAP